MVRYLANKAALMTSSLDMSPFQIFFIDHTSKTTTFIDPRLPNDLPILPMDIAQPHLLAPNDPASPLLPPPPPRNHRHSLTPPPNAQRSTSPTTAAFLAPPSSRRRSRSVGDDELNQSARSLNGSRPLTASTSGGVALSTNGQGSSLGGATAVATPPAVVFTTPTAYNDKVLSCGIVIKTCGNIYMVLSFP